MVPYVNIHTHRPTRNAVELRAEGVHPWYADPRRVEALAARLDNLRNGSSPEQIQAIGETGLDFACKVDPRIQLQVLRSQLALARQYGLPVVLHCVRAFEPLMRELAACPPRAVIFHGFIGSPEQARQALGRGYMLSFGVRVFASPKSLRALKEVPLTQLFLETDDDPVPIESLYERIAGVLELPVETLKRETFKNYERLFEDENGQLAAENRTVVGS